MEPDMQSLSFRSYRPSKRARSPDPDDESAPSRKRMSLTFGGGHASQPLWQNTDSPTLLSQSFQLHPMPEERWVAQTRHMFIGASPFGGGGALNVPTPPLVEDTSMSIDIEDSVCHPSSYLPTSAFIPELTYSHAPAYHVPEIHVSGAPLSYPTPAPSPRPPAFAQPQPQHASPPHVGMSISVTIPPTRAFLRAEHDAAQTPPIADTMGMQRLPLPVHAPQPRARFSMGPRADCEKCRLGIKGHYAHVD